MSFPIAAATRGSKGGTLTDFAALQRAGAVAVTDDGKPILDDDVMRMALRLGAELNFPVVQHAEDTRLTENCSMHEGPTSFRLGLRAMPAAAEAAIVDRDVTLAQQIRESRLHVAHLSTADALKAVRRGKRAKARVTCEVTPHHFTLIDENVGEYDTNFKMNPPLRSATDREAILVALADGTVDAIATDHAPHAAHEKQVEFERAAFGITGLETALALAITKLHREHKIPLTRIVELFTAGPARVFDLPRPRIAGARQLRRRDHFRSQEALDVRSRASRGRSRTTLPSTAGSSREKLWRRSLAGKLSTARIRVHRTQEDQMLRITRLVFFFALFISVSSFATAQASNGANVPSPNSPAAAGASSAPAFDVNAAVEAYLAKMPPARRARSNAYFEGGYWLLLWDFLSTRRS